VTPGTQVNGTYGAISGVAAGYSAANVVAALTAYSRVDSQVFYDYNNSGYYCDPAGTGNYNALTMAGTLTLNASGNAIVMNGSGSTNIQMNAGSTLRGYMYSDSSGVGILNSAGGWAVQVPYSQTYTYIAASVRSPLLYDSDNTAYYCDPASTTTLNTLYANGNLFINNASPTIYLVDSDHNSAMIHNNSNLIYILRGNGVGATSWATVGGYWPVYWDLTNNNATFGGAIWAAGNITAYSDIKL
jgi:hypothetical protein